MHMLDLRPFLGLCVSSLSTGGGHIESFLDSENLALWYSFFERANIACTGYSTLMGVGGHLTHVIVYYKLSAAEQVRTDCAI